MTPGTKFSITGNSLTLSSTIDFETDGSSFPLSIQAISTTTVPPTFTSTASMRVRIIDINDEGPVITGTFTATVDEELPVGTLLSPLFTATDADNGDVLSYSLTGTTSFNIDSGSGVISIGQLIDYDSGSTTFTFTVVVKDSASPAHTATQTLTVTIRNVNDNTPVFAPAVYYATVPENTASGITVTSFSITDKDVSDTVIVSIQSGDDVTPRFTVTSGAAIETTAAPIDYDSLGGQNYMYTLVLVGVDNGPGSNTGTATVFVTITGENDNAPAWTVFSPAFNAATPYNVNENVAAGTSIVTIAAVDADAGDEGDIVYGIGSVTSGVVVTTNGLFHMDAASGVLTVLSNTLDGDTATGGSAFYDIVVFAADQGTSPQSVTQTIRINVRDINDNIPICNTGLFTATVSENVVVGYSVMTVLAKDNDESVINNVVTYSVTGGSGMLYFVSDTNTGKLTTSSTIDYEQTTSYDIEVTVSDSGTRPLSSTCIVRITITDTNDNPPTFPASSIAISLPEKEPTGYSIATAQATDLDSSNNNNNVILYSFSSMSVEFDIGASTGIITTLKSLDREVRSSYTLIVLATDQGVTPLTGTMTYSVSVTDVNDNPPVITGSYDTSIDENTAPNTIVFTITATDIDYGPNAVLSYAITNGDPSSQFFIDDGSGLIQVRQPLDRETKALYNLEITVNDHGNTKQSSSVTATITIVDINDNNPQFSRSHYSFIVSEEIPVGTLVDTVVATDDDSGVNAIVRYTLAYFITGNAAQFNLDSQSGQIRTTARLDRERTDTYSMVVRATDRGTVPLTSTATVTISVTDYNDNDPVFSEGTYTGTTTENLPVGTSLLSVTVTDIDDGVNSDVILTIDSSNSAGSRANMYIAADSSTSVLYVKQTIDREMDSSFLFSLIATDRGNPARSTSASINITVNDVNDNKPVFSPSFYSEEVAYNDDCQGMVVTITATDADSGANAAVTYTTTQNNNTDVFTLNGITGEVQIVGTAMTDTTYVLSASARDGGNPALNTSLGATIRIDTYDPNDVILNYHLTINCSMFFTIESVFLTQLTAVYRQTYVAPEAKKWCAVDVNSTACIVRVYIIKDDTADELVELPNTKNLLTADESFVITSNDSNGTPSAVISGGSWVQFSITKVERYHVTPTIVQTSTSWFESATGIAVMSSVGVVALIAIITLVFYYKYRKPHGSRKSRVAVINGNRMFRNNPVDNKPVNRKTSTPRVSFVGDGRDGGKDMNANHSFKQNQHNVVKNRQFDGHAIDPATGRVYEYNTMSGDRDWIRTPDGDPN